MQAETTKSRHTLWSGILTPRLREAADQLHNNEKITITRADKAAIYVVLDRESYIGKCQDILQDRTKFEPLIHDPTESLKKHLNTLITAVNAKIGGLRFEKVVGDYGPGYFYGTVKTHKQGNPIRPIISQIPTPTYSTAKRLNQIISPYIPRTYSLRSTDEFIDILRVNRPRGIIASRRRIPVYKRTHKGQ